MDAPTAVSLVVVALVTLTAAATDLWKFKVYNVLTLPTLAVGLLVSPINGGIQAGLLGAALGFGLLAVFFALGGVGAGDVKLLTAIGAWLGPSTTLHVFIVSAMAGGVYALILLALQSGIFAARDKVEMLGIQVLSPSLWKRPEARLEVEVRREDRRRRLVPYAAMICAGFFVTVAISFLGR